MTRRLVSAVLVGLAGLTIAGGGIANATTTAAPAKRAGVCKHNPDPATPAQVVVSLPHANAHVTSPLKVKGKINAFEATFRIAIKNAAGNNIVAVTGMSQEGQTLSAFTKKVHFTVSARKKACLWIFQLSAKDGSVSMVKQVPITLAP